MLGRVALAMPRCIDKGIKRLHLFAVRVLFVNCDQIYRVLQVPAVVERPTAQKIALESRCQWHGVRVNSYVVHGADKDEDLPSEGSQVFVECRSVVEVAEEQGPTGATETLAVGKFTGMVCKLHGNEDPRVEFRHPPRVLQLHPSHRNPLKGGQH